MAVPKRVTPAMLGDGYLYISHLEGESCLANPDPRYWILPAIPDSISDQMLSTFTPTNALGRSAPVYTFSNAGPRTVGVNLKLHRDIMDDVNMGNSSVALDDTFGEDYVDSLIKAIQSIAVPKYNLSNKAVEPPLIAVRFAEQIFIKGIVTSPPVITYQKPILSNGKFAIVDISFTVAEVDPYDSTSVFKSGSFRGLVKTLSVKGLGFEE